MKLNEFAKKHAGGKVTFKGELLITNWQVHKLNTLKEALGAKFVNERAVEVLGANLDGRKLNELKRTEADQIIFAVEGYQHEVASGTRIPTGIPETVSRARKSHHTDDQPAYPHQIDQIYHLKREHHLLYGVICQEAFGRTIGKTKLTVLQARDAITAVHKIVEKREKMWAES